MTAADQLRQDLELTIVKLDEGDWGPIERVKDAARLWLRIMEGDEFDGITYCVRHHRESYRSDDCWESYLPKTRGECNRVEMIVVPAALAEGEKK